MVTKRQRRTQEEMKAQIISVAAQFFLERGFTDTTLKSIAEAADVNIGSLMNIYESKEAIMCDIIPFVIKTQYETAVDLLKDITDDELKIYATESCIQLYIVEMSENLRDSYCMGYSLPKTSEIVQQIKTDRLKKVFKERLPNLETKDFYMLEIATGGIMRGFMTVPCDMWFTIDQKIEAFIKTNFSIYSISNEETESVINFVKQFDLKSVARQMLSSIITHLETKPDDLSKGELK